MQRCSRALVDVEAMVFLISVDLLADRQQAPEFVQGVGRHLSHDGSDGLVAHAVDYLAQLGMVPAFVHPPEIAADGIEHRRRILSPRRENNIQVGGADTVAVNDEKLIESSKPI